LNLRPRELALDGGFVPIGVAEDLPGPDRVFIGGRQSAGSRRTDRRLARFRVGIEGRISHLKRRYGLNDPGSKATAEREPGRPGRSSPTTSTRSPSEPPENILRGPGSPARTPPEHRDGRALQPARPFSFQPLRKPLFRGK